MPAVMRIFDLFVLMPKILLAHVFLFFYVKMKVRWVDLFTLFFMGFLFFIFMGYLSQGFLMFYLLYYMVLQNYISDLKNMRAKNIPFESRNGEIWIVIWTVFSSSLFGLSVFYPEKYTVEPYMLFFPLAIVLYQFFWSKFMKQEKRDKRHNKISNFLIKYTGHNV